MLTDETRPKEHGETKTCLFCGLSNSTGRSHAGHLGLPGLGSGSRKVQQFKPCLEHVERYAQVVKMLIFSCSHLCPLNMLLSGIPEPGWIDSTRSSLNPQFFFQTELFSLIVTKKKSGIPLPDVSLSLFPRCLSFLSLYKHTHA